MDTYYSKVLLSTHERHQCRRQAALENLGHDYSNLLAHQTSVQNTIWRKSTEYNRILRYQLLGQFGIMGIEAGLI